MCPLPASRGMPEGTQVQKNCTENYFGRFQVTQSRPRWWCSGTWWHFGTPAQLNNQLEKQNAFLGFNSSAEPSVCHTENWEVFRMVKQCMALTIHCNSVLPLRGTKCSFPEKSYQFLQTTRTLSKKISSTLSSFCYFHPVISFTENFDCFLAIFSF